MFSHRSYELEILDIGPEHYQLKEYEECLKKLGQIGFWLGGNQASLAALNKLTPKPTSILDVGCGGGYFTLTLAKKFPQAKIVGSEVNPLAVAHANRVKLDTPFPVEKVNFTLKTQPELLEAPKSFDVVISTLVCHHLKDEILIDFLRRACVVAKQAVIINDLHRHPLAYFLFKAISALFFRNRLIRHDGPLSIRRAFSKADWKLYLAAANISPDRYHIKWYWAFRWLITIDCTNQRK